MLLVASKIFVRVAFGRLPLFVDEGLFVVAQLTMTACTLIQVRHCPTIRRPEWSFNKYAEMLDFELPVVFHALACNVWLHFGAVTWPRSLFSVLFLLVVQSAATVLASIRVDDFVEAETILVMLCGAHLFSIVAAGFAFRQKRLQFVSILGHVRDMNLIQAERDTARALAFVLFPKPVAERLLRSRLLTNRDASVIRAIVPAAQSKSKGPEETPSLHPHVPTTQRSSTIADFFPDATVVFMRVEGIDRVLPYETQLEVLSHLFIAADSVAESHHAIKVKSIGVSLLFVCGAPTCA